MPSIQGASHIGLTVRDMRASAAWYQQVFGWHPVRRYEEAGAGTPRIILYDADSDFALGLCEPSDGSSDLFEHRRTGLDHIALSVKDEDDLDAWILRLDDLRVGHSPKRDTGIGRFVSFEDPDGIQFELWLALG